MARTWNLRWQCCFATRTGKQYAVNIYSETSGSLVQLTGADAPFVTQEQDDDDVFVPMREMSGYLRVVDGDGTLLEQLMPANNTEKFVELVEGTYTGTWPNGTFTQASGSLSCLWRGFLQAEAYTQSWDGNAKVLEFPVRSLIGALADTQMDSSLAGNEENVAKILVRAMNALGVEPTEVVIASDFSYDYELMTAVVQLKAFFAEEEVVDEGDSMMVSEGSSYYTALSEVLALMGLTMREEGTTIVLAKYEGIVGLSRYTWAQVVRMSNGEQIAVSKTSLSAQDILQAVTFRGSDNVAGFLPGAKVAKVVLGLLDNETTMLQLPQTTEDTSQTYDIEDLEKGVSVIQPHEQRQGNNESYQFGACTIELVNGPSAAGAWHFSTNLASITLNTFIGQSIMNEPLLYPRFTTQQNILYVGALPCRFYASTSEENAPALANGMFLQLSGYIDTHEPWDYPDSGEDVLDSEIWVYRLSSGSRSWNPKNGYLLLDLDVVNYIADFTYFDNQKLYINNAPSRGVEDDLRYSLHLRLHIGDLFWNGTEWLRDTSASFNVDFVNGQMVGNKTSEMGVEGNGLFIPVTRADLMGVVGIEVLSAVGFNSSYRERDCHTFIFKSLSLTHVSSRSLTASGRTANVYRETILQSGFSGEQQIDLTLGTYNNNVDSASFLKVPGVQDEYLQKISYVLIGQVRPEVRLLQRLVAQYGQVRRTFQAVAAQNLDLLTSRYQYLYRAFVGIRKETDWQDEKEIVKFLEIDN